MRCVSEEEEISEDNVYSVLFTSCKGQPLIIAHLHHSLRFRPLKGAVEHLRKCAHQRRTALSSILAHIHIRKLTYFICSSGDR